MSLGVYPEFEHQLPSTKFEFLGEVLALNFTILDEIAQRANLASLTQFADCRLIPPDFDGDPDELAETLGTWTEWFDPTRGQVAMQVLLDHIRTDSEAAARLFDSDTVLDELAALAHVLSRAASHGVRFRLQLI